MMYDTYQLFIYSINLLVTYKRILYVYYTFTFHFYFTLFYLQQQTNLLTFRAVIHL